MVIQISLHISFYIDIYSKQKNLPVFLQEDFFILSILFYHQLQM